MKTSVQPTFQRAVRCHQSGLLAEAQVLYRAVLKAQPGDATSMHLLGVLSGQMGDCAAAVRLIRRAIALREDVADYHSNLGSFLIELRQEGAAIAACRRAIALNPDIAEAHLNLGVALAARDELEAAIASFRRAIDLKPDYAQAHNNLGAALKDLGRLEGAADSLREAIAHSGDFANAQWNLGLLNLLKGNFAEGWRGYEQRLKLPENQWLTKRFSQPLWNGEELNGRTILLLAEQGLGDTIQFVRYARLVARRGGRVIVFAPPSLRRLLARVEGIERVVCDRDALPKFDVQCPLLSLPRIFQTRLENIPAEIPYLSADPELAGGWSRRLSAQDRRRRIGLVWAGGSNHKRDRVRSVAPSLFSPLAAVSDARFFSLQKGEAGEQKKLLPAELELIDWTSGLGDFADTAALVAHLDLVITVDTAVAHLAGAMGKPVWLALPFILDWRWMLERMDSPWYPTMRLFRQPRRGDWCSVMQEMTTALRAA
jgi:tetratricopeptide (TPR) repeat protein